MSSHAEAYQYHDGGLGHHHAYLLPVITQLLSDFPWRQSPKRIFELGCGNGAVANELAALGYSITGIDPAKEGIEWARRSYPHLDIHQGSAYDDLAGQYGTFPVVLSLEVVEHLYDPRKFAVNLKALVAEGGRAIISTPYHGYWKNLALSVAGKWDTHHSPLWDHGHIKFWSVASLTQLLSEAGFKNIQIKRVGRIPYLAKSMVALASV